MIKGDQGLARKSYKHSLNLKKKIQVDEPIKGDHLKVNLVSVEPREDPMKNSLTPLEKVKVQIDTRLS